MADKSLFTRLQRLFSTDVVIRNVGGNQLKVMDTRTIQQTGELETNALIDRFARVYSNSPTSLYGSQNAVNYQTLRPTLYSEYDAMDTDAIVASALDIIADESTLKNDMGEVLHIKSSDENIQKILYNLFYDVLNVEFNLWPWIRNMCKYGDFFLKLEIAEKFGVYNVIPYTAYHIERIEGFGLQDPNEIKFRYDPDGVAASSYGYYNVPNSGQQANSIYFDNYEIAHFRLLADMNFLPYGRSYIEPARKLFKQYTLMEDAMLIHRIMRAPEKRIFKIDVGNMPTHMAMAFVDRIKNEIHQRRIPTQTGGGQNMMDATYNPLSTMEDYFFPVTADGRGSSVDVMPGGQNVGEITDLRFFTNKLFRGLRIPSSYLPTGADDSQSSYNDGRVGTAYIQELRFNKYCERLQALVCRVFDEEFKRINATGTKVPYKNATGKTKYQIHDWSFAKHNADQKHARKESVKGDGGSKYTFDSWARVQYPLEDLNNCLTELEKLNIISKVGSRNTMSRDEALVALDVPLSLSDEVEINEIVPVSKGGKRQVGNIEALPKDKNRTQSDRVRRVA